MLNITNNTNYRLNTIFRILNLFILTFLILENTHSTNQQNIKHAEKYQNYKKVLLDINIIKGTNNSGEIIEKNILTQDMVGKENTHYIIQYDYDLNNAQITIPEGCVLDFQGGSFNNGNVT